MGVILIEGIKCYAFHGCLEEESKIGGDYVVSVKMETDLKEAADTDDLRATIDYCDVYEIVKKEMNIRSKLIEHVAGRIITQLKYSLKSLINVEVTVTKISPPMNGDVEKASVTLKA